MTKLTKLILLIAVFSFAAPVSAQAHKTHHHKHAHHKIHKHHKKHPVKKLSGHVVTSSHEEELEPTPPPASFPMTLVSSCTPGPETLCPARYEFPWYHNDEIGDCQFAAAADWEILTQGIEPSEPEVLEAYERSGDNIWPYWESHPIDGITTTLSHDAYGPYKTITITVVNGVASKTETYTNPLQNVELMRSLIAQNAAVYVILNLTATESHAVIADGYTLTGPLLATWGHTYQVTWQAWGEYTASVETLERH